MIVGNNINEKVSTVISEALMVNNSLRALYMWVTKYLEKLAKSLVMLLRAMIDYSC